MKNIKIILTASFLLIIISFFIGYFWKNIFSKTPTENYTQNEKTTHHIEEKKVTEQKKTPKKTINYSKLIKGKYILHGAEYAGFDFIDDKTLTWTNEMFPMDPDTMKLKWISEDIFVGTFTKKHNGDCPPNVWVNKVISYDGQTLILKDIWTGWNDSKDEVKTFQSAE